MRTIALSVPSGAHHRSFLQAMRETFSAQKDWHYFIISPGAPWSDRFFPYADYPRDRFSFTENGAAAHVLKAVRPALLVTTTAGLDPADVPLLEIARELGIRSVTVIDSWDNVRKMDRVARGLGKGGQRIILPDHFCVWNAVMQQELLRYFPSVRPDQISIVGAPRLDYFAPRWADALPSREETLRSFGLNPTGRVLHLATTELYDHGHVAQAIGEAKQRGDLPRDLQLYASVHPGGTMDRHRPWAETYGFVMRFSPGRHEGAPHPDFRYNPTRQEILTLVALFKYTDVAVNLSSTVALESCVADRPVICAFFPKPVNWGALNPLRWFTMSERERMGTGSSTRPRQARPRSESFDPLARVEWRRSMVVRDFREHYADLLRGGGIAVARNPRQLVREIRTYLEHPEKDRAGRRRSAEMIATTLAGDACDRMMRVLQSLVSNSARS